MEDEPTTLQARDRLSPRFEHSGVVGGTVRSRPRNAGTAPSGRP
jgi:hypothetical protein